MSKYILSPEAQNSLKEIRSYSLKNFGAKRTKRYLQDIRNRMRDLAKDPNRGKMRDDLKAGYRSDFVGSHTIYYRTQDHHVDIIDILHQSMEPSRHFT